MSPLLLYYLGPTFNFPLQKKFNFTMKMEFIIYVHITYLLTEVTNISVNISVGIGSEKSFILESVI